MSTILVLTVIGPDQPGLVEALSETISDHGGSWAHSRMARLSGFFAGILEVSAPVQGSTALLEALYALESRGLKVMVEESRAGLGAEAHRVLSLELVGQDRPGIIREISAALAATRVNVVDLETEVRSAPMSGESHFHVTAELEHPAAARIEELRETLEKIAAELMVDIMLGESD